MLISAVNCSFAFPFSWVFWVYFSWMIQCRWKSSTSKQNSVCPDQCWCTSRSIYLGVLSLWLTACLQGQLGGSLVLMTPVLWINLSGYPSACAWDACTSAQRALMILETLGLLQASCTDRMSAAFLGNAGHGTPASFHLHPPAFVFPQFFHC